MNKFVDAHHHFWHPARGDYGWMPADDPTLSRPYGPADLEDSLNAAGVAGTVLVQAAPTVEETEYLLGIADATPHVLAVVGWVNFETAESLETLQRLASHPMLVGVRPMIQDLPDDKWMLREDIQWAFEALVDLDLTFDALGFLQHMDHFHTLLKRHPDLRVVLDHCLKPQIQNHSDKNFAEWSKRMSKLARETGAYCKLSGLVTEAGEDWDNEMLKPYVEHVLEVFTPQRIMWGSDWPVVRLRGEYEDWFSSAVALTSHLKEEERNAIFSATAAEFYRLKS